MGIYMNEIKEKSVEVSRTEVSHLLCNRDMNGAGRLFGGQLLMWIDEVAGIVAKRHCECNVTTASIDNLQFKEACYLGDVIVLIGYLTHVGNSSMEVRLTPTWKRKTANVILSTAPSLLWLPLMKTTILSAFRDCQFLPLRSRQNGRLPNAALHCAKPGAKKAFKLLYNIKKCHSISR